MRKVKVGDKIVVTKFDGIEIEPTIRTVTEIDEDKAHMLMDEPIEGNHAIEHENWIWDDDWRLAVRKGDRLVITRICEEDVEPTEVIAMENEWEVDDSLIYISKRVIPDKSSSYVLELLKVEYDDEWHFAEESPRGSLIHATPEYSDESEYVPQSFADFNASTGGGKTLKDYTGVDITAESIAFEGNEEKALKTITPESLSFTEDASDAVNHPNHYNRYSREVIESIKGLCTPEEFRGYLKGNIIKYSARYPDKGGIQDIDKLAKYTQFLKEFEIEMEGE